MTLRSILIPVGAVLACSAMLVPDLAAPAAAASVFRGWKPGAPCYARTYDAQHLASHPRQRLTHFALTASSLGAPVAPGAFELTFAFRLKGDPDVYQSEAICRETSGRVECGIEGDGGRFSLRPEESGLLLSIASMVVEGEGGISPDLAVGGDDRVVRLFTAPKSSCAFRS